MFSRRARAAHRVTAGLVDARADLDAGHVADARARLKSLQANLDRLDDRHGKRDFTALHTALLDTARAAQEGVPILTGAEGRPAPPDVGEFSGTAA